MSQFLSQAQIEAFKALETPFYYYDLSILDQTLASIKKEIAGTDFKIHYAIKANANTPVLEKIKEAGFGIDGVSGEEVQCAIEHGFSPDKIAFAGVGKTDKEIAYALKHDIFSFNIESLAELDVLNQIASQKNKKARVAIRFNPNVNAKTHQYITTGLEENKFGINQWELESLFKFLEEFEHIDLKGIHFHIGSQIRDLSVYHSLCNRVNEFQKEFLDRGYELEHINVGGGLGVNYDQPDEQIIPDFKAFFEIFKKFIDLRPSQELHFELGRSIIAQSAALISRVLYVKEGVKTNFAILDAGMTELIRPALYQSFHQIENLSKREKEKNHFYDVVGPICESSDCFGKAVKLPLTKRNDLIAIRTTGAYGEVMSSNYNLRNKAKAYYANEI